MPRQTLTPVVPVGPYPTLQPAVNTLDLAFTVAIVADKEQFTPSGDDLVLVWNKAVAAKTVTFSSAADPTTKRTGDITAYSIGAGEIAGFRFKKTGWMQSDGKIYMEAESTDIYYCVLSLG